MNSVRSHNKILKVIPSGCKDIEIRKFELARLNSFKTPQDAMSKMFKNSVTQKKTGIIVLMPQ